MLASMGHARGKHDDRKLRHWHRNVPSIHLALALEDVTSRFGVTMSCLKKLAIWHKHVFDGDEIGSLCSKLHSNLFADIPAF